MQFATFTENQARSVSFDECSVEIKFPACWTTTRENNQSVGGVVIFGNRQIR